MILATARKRGEYNKSARIITSDLLNRTMMYKIKADIVPEKAPTSPIVCMPKKLLLTTEDIGKTQKTTIKSVVVDSLDLKIVWFDSDFLDVRLPKSRIGPGESVDVQIDIKNQKDKKTFDKSITFMAGDTRLTLPVKVTPAKRVGSKAGTGG